MKKAFSILLLSVPLGCKMAPVDDTGQEDNCLATCNSELLFEFSELGDSFQFTIYGDEFNTMNLACPDEIRAGGPAQVQAFCQTSGVLLTADAFLFPTELTVALDGGAEQTVTPQYEEFEICQRTCNSAQVAL